MATLIDNIFTNTLHFDEHLNGILFQDISDHLPAFTITELGLNSQAISKLNLSKKMKQLLTSLRTRVKCLYNIEGKITEY